MMERAGGPRRIWSIVLVTLMLAGVVTAGLAGSVWASLYLAAYFTVIMLLAAVVVDHGWGALGRGALKVIAGVALVILLLGALGWYAYGFVVALVGAGMLHFAGLTPGGARMPRSTITGAMLLPPRRRRGGQQQRETQGGDGCDDARDVAR